jgi:superfamily II DNA or RNA helicase
MSDILLEKINSVWCRVKCDPGIQAELSQLFEFEVPGAKFMPSYKSKKWDGKIRLLKPAKDGPKIYAGLYHHIKQYALEKNYSFDSDFDWSTVPPKNFPIKGWYSKGKKIVPHDHQLKAIYKSLQTKRSIFISPTGSGKSLIIYTIVRLLSELVDNKIVILVPTISLVEQLYSDFEDYSNHDGFTENVTKIYSGLEKEKKKIIISTWQSLLNMEKNYFHDIDAIIGDEAHLYKGKEVSKLLEKFINAEYRYGFTGTLDGLEVNELILEGLFGPIVKVATTTELISENKLSDLKILCMTLNYSDEEKKKRFIQFEDEVRFLISHEKRNRFICDLADSTKGNTLILFSRVEAHGKLLYNQLVSNKKKKCYYIDGSTPAEEREIIRQSIDKEKDIIIVASSQVFSTGINIKSLRNIIFAYPSKSRIRTLQSIGRALRLHDEKENAVIYDISDDLVGKRPNYTWNHFLERLKIYVQEDFNYTIKKVELEKLYGKSNY